MAKDKEDPKKAFCCSHDGCRKKTHYARGMCREHWFRQWNRNYMRKTRKLKKEASSRRESFLKSHARNPKESWHQ